VADLIPARREELLKQFAMHRQYASAEELIEDKFIEVVSICVPNHLHAPLAVAALRAGKHVVCETPPALSAGEVRRMGNAAEKAGKTLLFSLQRRFGGCEQAARQAVRNSRTMAITLSVGCQERQVFWRT
jgi:predicted dehydrogenase